MTVVDTIFKALAPAIPDRVDRRPPRRSRRRPTSTASTRGRPPVIVGLGGLLGGGWGAKHDEDGMSRHRLHQRRRHPQRPVRADRSEISAPGRALCAARRTPAARAVSAAASAPRWWSRRAPIRFNAQIDRVHCRPWGLFGGLSAFGNGVAHPSVRRDGAAVRHGKAFNHVLRSGDAYIKRSGGGGGFGSPLDRDAAKVAWDVSEGYVSRQSAEDQYGVVFRGDSLEVDEMAPARGVRRCAGNLLSADPPDAGPDAHHGHVTITMTTTRR